MARFKQVYRIIEDVVNAIEWRIPITNYSQNPDGSWTIEMDCTAYLKPCYKFSDGQWNWQVSEEDFNFNESVKVESIGHSNDWDKDELVLTIPTYLHGTVRMSNAEYDEVKDQAVNTPIIYLYDGQSPENVDLSKKLHVERTVNARVFILMNNNFEDYVQINYDEEVYDPLSNIEEKFIEELLKNANISNFTERYARINHEQFGYTDRNGYLQRIFDGELSALELQLPLNINKCSNKDLNC